MYLYVLGFLWAVSCAYEYVCFDKAVFIQHDTVRYAPKKKCISACIWMYFESTYLLICTHFDVHICSYLIVFCVSIHSDMHMLSCAYLNVSECILQLQTCTYALLKMCISSCIWLYVSSEYMHIHQNGWVVLLRQIGRPQAHENQQGDPGPRCDARRRNGGPPRKEVAGAENEPSLRNEGADHQPEPSGLGGVGRSSIIVYSQKMIVTKRLDRRSARRKKVVWRRLHDENWEPKFIRNPKIIVVHNTPMQSNRYAIWMIQSIAFCKNHYG